mgnify:CR=1 FL=1
MQRRFVTCFRECGTRLIVDHKTQKNVCFESLTIVFDNEIVLLPAHHSGTCRKASLHTF